MVDAVGAQAPAIACPDVKPMIVRKVVAMDNATSASPPPDLAAAVPAEAAKARDRRSALRSRLVGHCRFFWRKSASEAEMPRERP